MSKDRQPEPLTPAEAARRLAALEERLNGLRHELEHSAQLATIGMMTAGIAHEINNLLTPIIAYAQLAESRPNDTEIVQKCLSRTRIAGEATAHILRAVLEFSKPDEPSTNATAPIERCLDAALECMGRQLELDNIALHRSIEPGLEAPIAPKSLQQILLNLVTNSQRALQEQRGGTITVQGRQADDQVILEVADDGPGFPPTLASTLFDPFVTGSVGGNGLGLKLVRDAVQAAGGDISASSTGPGAAFKIVFPAVQAIIQRKAG